MSGPGLSRFLKAWAAMIIITTTVSAVTLVLLLVTTGYLKDYFTVAWSVLKRGGEGGARNPSQIFQSALCVGQLQRKTFLQCQ